MKRYKLVDDQDAYYDGIAYVGTAKEISRLERKMRDRETVWFCYTEPAQYNPERVYALLTEDVTYGNSIEREGRIIRAEDLFLYDVELKRF